MIQIAGLYNNSFYLYFICMISIHWYIGIGKFVHFRFKIEQK